MMAGRGARRLMLLREHGLIWERRAALTPRQVGELIKRVPKDVEILVQPCSRRVFKDQEYVDAGAVLEEDPSVADVLLGVKQPEAAKLAFGKTYCCFSHTHKGQTSGEALLRACLEKEVRLVDWERVVDSKGRRTVAFGRFAGIAGMHEAVSGVGRALLRRGVSTDLLGVPSTFSQPSLEHAFNTLRCAALPELPDGLAPFIVAFTGSGNVASGALEAFDKLPNSRLATLDDVRDLVERGLRGELTAAERRTFYGLRVEEHHLARRKSDRKFEKKEYRERPELYESNFVDTVGPLVSCLVHDSFWAPHFPPLLTTADVSKTTRLMTVSDVSCDFSPSSPLFDGVHHATAPDQPWYEVVGERDLLVTAIDILPSALPREASAHFGDAVLQLAEPLLDAGTWAPLDALDARIRRAVVTDRGSLTPDYAYIAGMHDARRRQTQAFSDDLEGATSSSSDDEGKTRPLRRLGLRGHLFDSGLINALLDLVESTDVDFALAEATVERRADDVDKPRVASSATIDLRADDPSKLDRLVDRCRALVAAMPHADATLFVADPPLLQGENRRVSTTRAAAVPEKIRQKNALSDLSSSSPLDSGSKTWQISVERPRVAVLGAGLVAGPLLEELRRDCHVIAHAASSEDLDRVGGGVVADFNADANALASAVRSADLVVSLLPPPMHAKVARACLQAGRDLITASYATAEMDAVGRDFAAAGLRLVVESGLDPGMDHASAARLLDEIRSRHGTITAFASVCGGLPAPDAAKNALAYRFSWSPAGVFAALDQPATYAWRGSRVSVDDVLAAAVPYTGFPGHQLDVLPNRDARPFARVYGLPDDCDIFRGTLRFSGFAPAVRGLRGLGALPAKPHSVASEADLAAGRAVLDEADLDPAAVSRTDFAQHLGRVYALDPRQADLCLMRHDIAVTWPSGHCSRFQSSLEVLGVPGGDTAMAKTVGLTCALMTRLAVVERAAPPGLTRPSDPSLHGPLLQRLAQHGLIFQEQEFPGQGIDAFPFAPPSTS